MLLWLPDTTSQGNQEVGEPHSAQMAHTQLRAKVSHQIAGAPAKHVQLYVID